MAYPGGKPNVGDEARDVAGAEVNKAEEGHEEDSRGGSHALHLDHGQDLWHLALHGTSVEQPREGVIGC